VLEGAAAAGLELRHTQSSARGSLGVAVEGVAAVALFGWLDSLRREHGIAPVSLRVARKGDLLRAEAIFDTDSP
jgi:general secretion pathway protein M